MSSIMRCRSDVMGSSFARWNSLQAATPCLRKGAYMKRRRGLRLKGVRFPWLGVDRRAILPRSGLVQGTECRLSEYADPAGTQALNGGPRQNHVDIFRASQETQGAYRMAGNGRDWYLRAWSWRVLFL